MSCGSISDAHGYIRYVAKNPAMKYTHMIGMLFTGLEFDDCLSASYRCELKADQLRIPLSMAWIRSNSLGRRGSCINSVTRTDIPSNLVTKFKGIRLNETANEMIRSSPDTWTGSR
jgi:hypothetical protein